MSTDSPCKILVAYHEHCIDGRTSAWVTARALEERGYPVELLPMEYKESSLSELDLALRDVTIGRLYVVDFSLDVDVLEELSHLAGLDVTILDHHKTAFEKYAPGMLVESDSVIRKELHHALVCLDNDESGASLCWNYFYPGLPMPTLVRYVKDYDLWRFDLGEETKWVNKYLKAQPFSLSAWDRLARVFALDETRATVLEAGKLLQETHDISVKDIASSAFNISLKGKEGLAVECPYELCSDVGHMLATESNAFGAMYQLDRGKGEVNWSLRSNGDYDVSAIAKSFGGGGHKNAAGFVTTLLEAYVLLGRSSNG